MDNFTVLLSTFYQHVTKGAFSTIKFITLTQVVDAIKYWMR